MNTIAKANFMGKKLPEDFEIGLLDYLSLNYCMVCMILPIALQEMSKLTGNNQ